MRYAVTIRYGTRQQRYHTAAVDAENLVEALRRAADAVPPEIAGVADLVEIRPAVDPDERTYVEEAR